MAWQCRHATHGGTHESFQPECGLRACGMDLERGDVDDLLAWIVVEDPQHGQLSADCFA